MPIPSHTIIHSTVPSLIIYIYINRSFWKQEMAERDDEACWSPHSNKSWICMAFMTSMESQAQSGALKWFWRTHTLLKALQPLQDTDQQIQEISGLMHCLLFACQQGFSLYVNVIAPILLSCPQFHVTQSIYTANHVIRSAFGTAGGVLAQDGRRFLFRHGHYCTVVHICACPVPYHWCFLDVFGFVVSTLVAYS